MLATIGIVDCIFRCVASARPVSIVGHGERPFRFRLNGTERNGNVTVLLTPTVYTSVARCQSSRMCGKSVATPLCLGKLTKICPSSDDTLLELTDY